MSINTGFTVCVEIYSVDVSVYLIYIEVRCACKDTIKFNLSPSGETYVSELKYAGKPVDPDSQNIFNLARENMDGSTGRKAANQRIRHESGDEAKFHYPHQDLIKNKN